MNQLRTIISGSAPVLDRVTWPLAPYDDESLAGFTARTCVYNGLWKPSVVLADAGINLQSRVGHLPRFSGNLSALALLLALDPQWIENRRHRNSDGKVNTSGSIVDFHGAALRRAHLDYSAQRVAPSKLRKVPYHREIWHVLTLAACAETGELLVGACQVPGCSKTFGWGGPRGIGHCLNARCDGSVESLYTETLPLSWLPGLALAASLISTEEEDNDQALMTLPSALRCENRGDLFELAWLVGCLDHPEGAKMLMLPGGVAPKARCEVLARGADQLRDWPSSITALLRRSAEQDDDATNLRGVVRNLRAIVKKGKTLGRAAELLSLELRGANTAAFPSVLANRLGLLTATDFAQIAGLRTQRMASLQRSTHLPRILLYEGGRDIGLFSRVTAIDVRRRVDQRTPAQSFASKTGMGIDAVELLVGDNVLSLSDDPIIQAIWPLPHLQRGTAETLKERLLNKVKRNAPDGSVRLAVALRGYIPGEKPWPAIIKSFLCGHINLYDGGAKVCNLRSCFISPTDVEVLLALPQPDAPHGIRSKWLSEMDARERLSVTGLTLRSLVKARKLFISSKFNGQTYRRSAINRLVRGYVSALELRQKLGIRDKELHQALAAVCLEVDEHGLVPRTFARERLIFAL